MRVRPVVKEGRPRAAGQEGQWQLRVCGPRLSETKSGVKCLYSEPNDKAAVSAAADFLKLGKEELIASSEQVCTTTVCPQLFACLN